MSEDEEKPEQKENPLGLVPRQSLQDFANAIARTQKISDESLKIQMSGIMQAAYNVSKMMESVQDTGRLLASYQSPMINGLLAASKNMDKIIEEARKRAEMIAQADIMAGAGIKPSDVNHSLLLGFSRDLENVEDVIDAIPEEIQEEVPQLKEEIDSLKTQMAVLMERVETLEREKQEAKEPLKISKVSKRGPKSPSDADKLKALQEWDKLDKSVHAITLAEFLEEKFGTEGGILRVAESTFHGWRRMLRKKGLYRDS